MEAQNVTMLNCSSIRDTANGKAQGGAFFIKDAALRLDGVVACQRCHLACSRPSLYRGFLTVGRLRPLSMTPERS